MRPRYSVTRLGYLLDFVQVFKAFGSNEFACTAKVCINLENSQLWQQSFNLLLIARFQNAWIRW